MRGFVTLMGGRGNGLTYHLYIAENHPVLNNFPFQTGYYQIETDQPIEKRTGRYNGYSSTGGESNPFNFTKFVEAGDQISITPYEISDKPVEKPSKNKPKENNQIEGGKNNNFSASNRKLTDKTETAKSLVQYFQENDIKEIRFENGELVITHNNNNNEIVSTEKKNNDHELKNIESYLIKNEEKSLKLEELNKLLNNSNNSQNFTPNSPKK